MSKLPPSVAVILGLVIGLGVGISGAGLGMYFYMRENVRADIAEVELETVIDGENAASEIRDEKEKDVKKANKFKQKVKDGQIKIVTSGGKYINPDVVKRLQRKIECAKPEPNCPDNGD
jgi:hypothetical protein